jgi:adenylyltransferase/sulfurtransferase
MDLTDEQIDRYARHIVLKEVGGAGQQALLAAKVLIIGAGGLGSPLLMYLAAAGVGTIGLVDDDVVSLSNLQRQVAHTTDRVDLAKTESARRTIAALNPGVTVVAHQTRLDADNAARLIADYDVIADGSDNFATRFLINDVCYWTGRTLVSAAILRFDGQLATFKPYLGDPHPCYRCIFGAPPPDELAGSCSQDGVLGALAGTMGAMQGVEVLKEILGIGESLSGQLLIYDALSALFRKVRVRRDPNCRLCGDNPTITAPESLNARAAS